MNLSWAQKKQLKQYIISGKTAADALKITVLNTKISSASGGGQTLSPHRGRRTTPNNFEHPL